MGLKVIEVVAGVIFDENSRILVCERPQGKALAGYWEFPGGKVEAGEKLAAALERELIEELALPVTVLDEIYCLEIKEPEKVLKLHFLRALAGHGSEPQACENQRFCWLSRSELDSVRWLPTDQEFVKYLSGK